MNNNNNNNNDATIVPSISINDSPVKTYLRSIGNFPVLTADEEKQKFIDYKAVYDQLPKLSDDVFTVDNEAAATSPLYDDYLDMREELINDNLKLVVYIAKRYRNNHLSYLDLIQEGNLGLIEAIDRFNPELGFRFSTFATPWIKQAIIKAITDKGKMVRIPAHIFQLQKRCRDAENELMQEDANLTPSDVDIARKLHERVDKIELARKNMTDVISMDSKVGGDDDGGNDSSRADSICDFVADDEQEESQKINTSELGARLLDLLKGGSLSLEELVEGSGTDFASVSMELLELQGAGLINQNQALRYYRRQGEMR